MAVAFRRYVAIGDSSTEGLEDPDPRGGYRGWSRRLGSRLASLDPALEYANLAVRGRETRVILREQLEPALDMRPDFVTLFCGTNDAVRRRFDVRAFSTDLEEMQSRLIDAGATVLGFTMPDPAPVVPSLLVPALKRRFAELNGAIREVSARTGTLILDFEDHPVASDPRLWHEDRLHANALGHERIAAGLARRLGLPGTDDSWADPLPTPGETGRLGRTARELRWWLGYFLPWVVRHARGRSSGDGRTPSLPRPVRFVSHVG